MPFAHKNRKRVRSLWRCTRSEFGVSAVFTGSGRTGSKDAPGTFNRRPRESPHSRRDGACPRNVKGGNHVSLASSTGMDGIGRCGIPRSIHAGIVVHSRKIAGNGRLLYTLQE